MSHEWDIFVVDEVHEWIDGLGELASCGRRWTTVTGYSRWQDIRAEYVARLGGADAVQADTEKPLTETTGQRPASSQGCGARPAGTQGCGAHPPAEAPGSRPGAPGVTSSA